MLKRLKSISQKIQFPAICNLCSQYHNNLSAICEFCSELLISIGSQCEICALPIPQSSTMTCGKCLKKKPWFDKVFVNYIFEEPLRTILHDFKYKEGLYLTSFLTDLMFQNFDDDLSKTECLIPVPLHLNKLKARGFNQSALLAKKLAKQLNLPVGLDYCQKTLNTLAQAGLKWDQRSKNLKNAFRLKKTIPYKNITLIDDLITTGSTANELAKVLKNHGIEKVYLWCVARTVE